MDPGPVRVQVAGKLAVNCWVAPPESVMVAGETAGTKRMVTVVKAVAAGLAVLVAVMVTIWFVATEAGAV